MMAEKAVSVVGLFLTISICCSPLFSYGLLTDPNEVAALLAVRRSLKDPSKNLNWTKKQDPCTSKWTGLICKSSDTDGYMHAQELRLLGFNLYGTLAPELGQLPYLKRLDFMWNNMSGSIPKEIGNIKALENLLLSGNQLSGPLPDELGYLPNLNKFQLDLNFLSGPIPKSFANLPKVQHFHMNNNKFSGQIPSELYTLPLLKHFLLDNNNLSGYLPPEFSQMPSLTILQLDNNNFAGSVIPETYGNLSKLRKLSLRNCNLQGTIPDLSGIRSLLYLDLSINQLTGKITSNRLSENITTIILSNNKLNGSIPSNFSGLSRLQKLYLNSNLLSGSVPSTIWENVTFTPDAKLDINFEDNLLSDISGMLDVPPNVTLRLRGNPVCASAIQQNISLLCGPDDGNEATPDKLKKPVLTCQLQSCPLQNNYEYVPTLPENTCFCAAPFGIGLRLRSPSISNFLPYRNDFKVFITTNVHPRPNASLQLYQLSIDSLEWEPGPRLKMFLLFFPEYTNDSNTFDGNEIQAIANTFATFALPSNDIFGPYDLLNFTAGFYSTVLLPSLRSKSRSKGALAGIILGSVIGASVLLAGIMLFFRKLHPRTQGTVVKNQSRKFIFDLHDHLPDIYDALLLPRELSVS